VGKRVGGDIGKGTLLYVNEKSGDSGKLKTIWNFVEREMLAHKKGRRDEGEKKKLHPLGTGLKK